jgi:asparagine synthase (glutamine-hydrolysing)
MNARMVHRGPDDSGEYWSDAHDVGLAMRRLSIIDISGGRQPMCNESGDVWIVFNGEIYNSPALRDELIAKGHRFESHHSDTEAIIHLYEEVGGDCLKRLNGMFGLIIYDKRKETIFAARDRMGIKPLYFAETLWGLALASELKCFTHLPGFDRRINNRALYHYLSLLYVPGTETIFDGVMRLAPGTCMEYHIPTRTIRMSRFWNIDATVKESRSEEEWTQLIKEQMKTAIRRRLLSDVPVGCLLSGGLDSTAMVALLAEMGHSDIKTYSLGFTGNGEDSFNELPLAREVAEKYGTDHHELVLDPQTLLDDLPAMVWHLDEPYAGGLPAYYVYKFMRQDVTVGLNGTGGDELFGNYGKYLSLWHHPAARRAWAYREASDISRKLFWEPARAIAPHLGGFFLPKKVANGWASLPQHADLIAYYFYVARWYYFDDETKLKKIFAFRARDMSTGRFLQNIFNECESSHPGDCLAYLDFKTQLSEEFLFNIDRLSMAHSLEARVPFLDHEMVELVFKIDYETRSHKGDLKYLWKKTIGDLLPPNLLSAPKKGFVIPITKWLRGPLKPLAETLLSPERLAAQEIFRPEVFQLYVQPHIEGRSDFTWQVWALLMFQLWNVVFIENDPATKPTYSWRDLV